MKRRVFIRELEAAGCEFVRLGRRHDHYRALFPQRFGLDG
jgi:hypothetical protein